MYNIYFEKRVLRVCEELQLPAYDPNAVIYHAPEDAALSALPALFENTPRILKMIVPAAPGKLEENFRCLCESYRQINAGGGLVRNGRGEYLLILRNGCWDLPKGKQDPGEDIETTACREVEEECGISGIEIKDLLCITRHCYRRNGSFILKHTYWYNMLYTAAAPPVPQQEENIQKVLWVKKEELSVYLEHTYPSIREVFEKAGLV